VPVVSTNLERNSEFEREREFAKNAGSCSQLTTQCKSAIKLVYNTRNSCKKIVVYWITVLSGSDNTDIVNVSPLK